MSDERFLLPQDHAYFQSVGLATIAFARLEWIAVWCCERLQTDYIHSIEAEKKTAGTIGKNLTRLFGRISDPALRAKALPVANAFSLIVDERNGLVHGKPGTSEDGGQRLFRNGVQWTVEKVDDFSDRCAKTEISLNELFYSELQGVVPLNP